jgi:signal transduction histidine kinase
MRVQDNGIGIPSADLPRIFERYRRASNVAAIAGTGLRLAGAREIVAQHGGRVEIDSVEGRGTTVVLRLPAHGSIGSPAPPGRP